MHLCRDRSHTLSVTDFVGSTIWNGLSGNTGCFGPDLGQQRFQLKCHPLNVILEQTRVIRLERILNNMCVQKLQYLQREEGVSDNNVKQGRSSWIQLFRSFLEAIKRILTATYFVPNVPSNLKQTC